jgi:hypothetical protein
MIWLTWRQFRTQAAAVYAAVAAASVVLAITGPRLIHLAQRGGNLFDRLTSTDRDLFFAGIVVVAVAPALIGAFWGAPLVARELEAGTHRLAWTQSVTRTRWLAMKLGVTVVGAAAAVGALTLAVSWWADPIDGAVSTTRGSLPSRMTPVAIAMRGIAPVGYVVFAVVLGATLGVVLRRSLVAMALTLAVFTAFQIAVPLWVRPHLVAPVHETVVLSQGRLDGIMANDAGGPVHLTVNTGSPGNWTLSNETVNTRGKVAALPSWMAGCLPPPPTSPVSRVPVGSRQVDTINACLDRLTAEGYRQRLVYQPASHFWSLQWAETGLYLSLSGLLTGFCFRWTRRRLS